MKLIDYYKGCTITNEQMLPNRFGRWAKARNLFSRIQTTLENSGIVTITTATRATHYYRENAPMFRATQSSVYVQRAAGRWDCIDYCAFVFRQKGN